MYALIIYPIYRQSPIFVMKALAMVRGGWAAKQLVSILQTHMMLTCGLITMHGSRYFFLLEKPIAVLVKPVVNLVQTSDISSINITKHKIMRIPFAK